MRTPTATRPTADELGACPTPAQRADPLQILATQAESRVADLIPVRHARMAATPFTFYRGAAAVMSDDLSKTPDTGIITQLCGDAHLSNLGLFFSPERRMVFDLNDFDETHVGPFEWDLKRLAASFAIAGRNNGFDDAVNRKIAKTVAKAYRRAIARSVGKTTLECWYDGIDVEAFLAEFGPRLDTSMGERTQKALKKARHRDSAQALAKLCVIDDDGTAHIRSDPPLLVPLSERFPAETAEVVEARVRERVDSYRDTLPLHVQALLAQFSMVDIAFKVVGVGSVGTRAWIVLMTGRNLDDPLVLQVKEAQRSVLSDHVPASGFDNQGQRVVEGQRLLQAASDLFLGWSTGTDENGERRDFYVRQLRDGKGSVVVEALEPDGMKLYAQLCGLVLAQAHARTASRFDIARYLEGTKGFSDAIAEFSVKYADLNDGDHTAMMAAIERGKLDVYDLAGDAKN
ncbi:DUF2252 domain-containing protein [Gordonia jinghuaiqii]|uniref:DUF2252 domain-containing protein n=1 Tax=Gordonia jinghuaiqii TaxID=2758710 RepID=A0A7D7QQA8_9ACTN|nr:DUF2252 domain-containing protein [Gordonia jinghuaiqii]MCR5980241.1 DUF2252 domain-containing protein [Gordonia jinghuaiqii]QMT02006.1 DUF2252 domain-containing protein [Gordonia jinghuaiqii]